MQKVSLGFSIPPIGKPGGKTNISYLPHRYGPYNFSACETILPTSENSFAAFAIIVGSAYTPVRASIALKAISPTASAIK